MRRRRRGSRGCGGSGWVCGWGVSRDTLQSGGEKIKRKKGAEKGGSCFRRDTLRIKKDERAPTCALAQHVSWCSNVASSISNGPSGRQSCAAVPEKSFRSSCHLSSPILKILSDLSCSKPQQSASSSFSSSEVAPAGVLCMYLRLLSILLLMRGHGGAPA